MFEREELSAVPDVGWPDCFNSGVFVFRPSVTTYGRLIKFAEDHGSFDGLWFLVYFIYLCIYLFVLYYM